MGKIYRLELDAKNLGHVLDALESRALAWLRTAEFHRTGESPLDFLVEECTDAEEADRIAAGFQNVIQVIKQQKEQQG